MAATKQNVAMHAGNDFSVTFTMNQSVTGATAIRWGLSLLPAAPALIDKTLADAEIEIVNAGMGVRVVLAAAETAALAPGNYYHELEVTLPTTGKKTVATGDFSILPTLF